MPNNMAMHVEFLSAFGRLPRAQQRGVRNLISRFNADPTASGLNYERIQGAADPNMRSLRIDRDYRAIVARPERGRVHMLLWADKHDDAYSWATRRRCDINPATGAVQVYLPQADAPAAAQEAAEKPPGAFVALKDRELMRLGVPEAMLAEVRGVASEEALDAVQARLPTEAYEALFLLLAGESYEQLVREREAPEAVDTGDFETALKRPESQMRFAVAADEMELEAMLNAPLERWRVFLHPSQRRVAERDWNGPVRLLGGAGTGKTVVAMHHARWLVRNHPESRVLFTTFTRNLAADIEHNLGVICSPAEMKRIEVTNLDRWVVRFLKMRRYEFSLQFNRNPEAWQIALDAKPPAVDLPDAFFEDEWEQVIQAADVQDKQAYLRVSRTGRGTRLARSERALIWPVFAEYRAQLAERGVKEVDDAYRDAAALLAAEPPAAGDFGNYDAVIVDEAQDMGAAAFRLLRAIAPSSRNDLFITGDGHQRIYSGRKVVLGRCGIDIRGRSRKLRLNYRTTEQTRRWAAGLLAGREIDDLDGGADDNRGIKSLTRGPEPQLAHFATREEHNAHLLGCVRDLQAQGQPLRGICVATRTSAERDAAAQALAGQVEHLVVGRGADDGGQDGVRVATMHRVKGLEFDHMVLASVNAGLMPLRQRGKAADAVADAHMETEERSLLYVAATRAKKSLTCLSFGTPSRFLGGDGEAA